MAIIKKLNPGEYLYLDDGSVVQNLNYRNATLLLLTKEEYEKKQQLRSSIVIRNENEDEQKPQE